MYEMGMRIPLYKQYSSVTNQLHLYVTDYYISVFAFTLLVLTVCLSLVSAITSLDTTFTTIVICHQSSTGPMDLFLSTYLHLDFLKE